MGPLSDIFPKIGVHLSTNRLGRFMIPRRGRGKENRYPCKYVSKDRSRIDDSSTLIIRGGEYQR